MQFKANLFLTILALLVLIFLLRLGFWQLDRAQQKQDILDLQSARINLPAVDISTIRFDDNNLRYLPIKAEGFLDTDKQILIDNQVKNGQVGFFVLTPLKLSETYSILVNRGWLAAADDIKDLPDVQLDAGDISITGKFDHFPSVGLKLDGADQLSEGWPAMTQLIDLDKVSKRLGYDILPYQILLDQQEPNGYDRHWLPMKMGPEKHYGYAFQWFALAAAWVIIYIVLTIKIDREKKWIK